MNQSPVPLSLSFQQKVICNGCNTPMGCLANLGGNLLVIQCTMDQCDYQHVRYLFSRETGQGVLI